MAIFKDRHGIATQDKNFHAFSFAEIFKNSRCYTSQSHLRKQENRREFLTYFARVNARGPADKRSFFCGLFSYPREPRKNARRWKVN